MKQAKTKNAMRKAKHSRRAYKARSPEQIRRLSRRMQEARTRSLNALREMRTPGLSLYEAARAVGVDPRTVRRWTNPALQRGSNGRYAAKPSDRLLRLLVIPGPGGSREVAVRGSRKASELAKYAAAVQRFLSTGDAADLNEFDGRKILDANRKPIEFLTDLDMLELLGSAGVLSFESLYAGNL